MALMILYKLYKSFDMKDENKENRVSKNRNTLINNKYLKKIKF